MSIVFRKIATSDERWTGNREDAWLFYDQFGYKKHVLYSRDIGLKIENVTDFKTLI